MAGEPTRQGVDAVEVVGTILQALLSAERPARLKDLETSTGIASAKLHRYLVSMVRCGLVRRSVSGNRYDFGLLTYRMGQVAAHDHSVLSLLEPTVEKFLADAGDADPGLVFGIGQWVGHGATIVRWFESNSPVSIRMKPGVQLSVTSSATAKLLAAYLPRDTTEALVRQELSQNGACTQADVERVYDEYAGIRRDGIAASLSARRAGLNALSVPLFDQQGQLLAAISALGMAPNFDADIQGPSARLLRQLSGVLSTQLGTAPG